MTGKMVIKVINKEIPVRTRIKAYISLGRYRIPP
jgi:hypothetical protein